MARYRALGIAILGLLVGFASEADATPFSFLPNGDLLVGSHKPVLTIPPSLLQRADQVIE